MKHFHYLMPYKINCMDVLYLLPLPHNVSQDLPDSANFLFAVYIRGKWLRIS